MKKIRIIKNHHKYMASPNTIKLRQERLNSTPAPKVVSHQLGISRDYIRALKKPFRRKSKPVVKRKMNKLNDWWNIKSIKPEEEKKEA